jgi:hypothetical protein
MTRMQLIRTLAAWRFAEGGRVPRPQRVTVIGADRSQLSMPELTGDICEDMEMMVEPRGVASVKFKFIDISMLLDMT